MTHTQLSSAALAALEKRFGDNFSASKAIREHHGALEGHHGLQPPEAVVFATHTGDVVDLVNICREYSVPIIPFGAGSSLEGHVAAVAGGVSLDMSNMNAIIGVFDEDRSCRVQAGVTRQQLNEHLRHSGMFFPVDPGAEATLGGMAATRASGTNAVRYGTMSRVVRSLQVVMADGQIVETGRNVVKSAAGYDLTSLMIGSEGTLGIVTELTVELSPLPDEVLTARCSFDTIEQAVRCVVDAHACAVPVAKIELMNRAQVLATNRYSKTALEEKPSLVFECHGTKAGLAEQLELLKAVAEENGGGTVEFATKTEDRNALWKARHEALFAVKAAWPDHDILVTDVCVPISKLPDTIAFTEACLKARGLDAPIVGHVGDGNFHTFIPVKQGCEESRETAELLNNEIVRHALLLGGTCTGEHGIGAGKKGFLRQEKAAAVPVMQLIKKALDPDNILNPGKIF